MKARLLGNLYNAGTGFAGNVFDKDFIAPTLMNMQGGGRQPMIIVKSRNKQEVKVIAQMDNTIDNTFESANRIYSADGLAPTLPTGCGGGHTPKILCSFRRTKQVPAV